MRMESNSKLKISLKGNIVHQHVLGGIMSLIDDYLYSGEQVRQLFAKKGLFGAEEIAATNMRIIHAKGKKHSDIKYGFITSIGDRTLFDWKPAAKAAFWLLIAALFFWAYLSIPGAVASFANNLQIGIDNTTSTTAESIANVGNSAQSVIGEISGNNSSVAPPEINVDVASSVNGAGSILPVIAEALGIFFLAIAVFDAALFVLSIKRGIVVQTPGRTFAFSFPGSRKAEAQEFIKTVRSAEEEKVKVLQAAMPELFVKER